MKEIKEKGRKMEKDLVSIIVPVYNAENFIQEAIQTVQEQTYKKWELLLINDGSTDNSKNLIKNYEKEDKRIKIITLDKNKGVSFARNIGIENSNGEYIAFLDADDLWKKDKLEKQIEFMKKNKYAFTFTGYEFVNENGKKGKIVKVPAEITYKEAIKNTTIFTSTVILNVKRLGKELIKMPNVKRGQDTATWWKILKNNNTGFGLNENLSFYRRSTDTLSSNKIKALKRTWDLYRKVEKMTLAYSLYNFVIYVYYAIKRRV